MRVFVLVFLVGITIFANDAQDTSLSKYDNLYRDGKYELIVKDLVPAIAANDEGKDSFITFNIGSDIIHARNLVADSYRMLEKYTKAADWYFGTEVGYFDSYANYNFGIIQRVSFIKGRKVEFENIGLFKLIDNISLEEKQQYFKEAISRHPNRILDLQLFRYLAGEISLQNLLQDTPKENFIEYTTYAGLNLEGSGDLQQARRLYTQVLEEKSDKIEALLAANRMGLLALKMIYTTLEEYGGLIELTDVYAVKVSSAKLEEDRLYSAYNLIDEDSKTAWVPVGKNGGIGEWVEISFDDPVSVNVITLVNGYAKSDIAFNCNNRIKKATLEFSDGSQKEILLEDTVKPQTIKIGKKTRTVRIYIKEIYKGTKYDDTCISGIDLDFKELP